MQGLIFGPSCSCIVGNLGQKLGLVAKPGLPDIAAQHHSSVRPDRQNDVAEVHGQCLRPLPREDVDLAEDGLNLGILLSVMPGNGLTLDWFTSRGLRQAAADQLRIGPRAISTNTT